MWVHPTAKFLVFFFFLQWTTLIGPSQKNHDTLIFHTNINIFYQYGSTMWLLFQGIYWNTHPVLLHCLSRTFIPKCVHHHFWIKLLQELRYLLGFILINLVVGHHKVFECFDGCFFGNGPFGWLLTKNLWNLPSSSRNHIYIYIYITCESM